MLLRPEPIEPPPGFQLFDDALRRFLRRRVRADNEAERDYQHRQAKILIDKALVSGALVVLIQAKGDKPKRVRPHLWALSDNVQRLCDLGASWQRPLLLEEDFYKAEGIALVDKTNFMNFSKWAGRWPPFKIPPAVRVLLDVCNEWSEMSKGTPIRKSDVIALLRVHWPEELEKVWPREVRFSHQLSELTKDDCPSEVSKLAEVILLPKSWSGRKVKGIEAKIQSARRNRRDPRKHPKMREVPNIKLIIDD